MKALLIAASALMLSPPAAPEAEDPAQIPVQAIAGEFQAAYRACGLEPLFEPRVRIGEWPVIMSYNYNQRTVYVGRYDELPAEM